jgi:hypothetical protein
MVDASMNSRTFDLNVQSGLMTQKGVYQTLCSYLGSAQSSGQIAAYFQSAIEVFVQLCELTGCNMAAGVDELYTVGRIQNGDDFSWFTFSLTGLGNSVETHYHGWFSPEFELVEDDELLEEYVGSQDNWDNYPILKLPEGYTLKAMNAREAIEFANALIGPDTPLTK